MTWKWINPGYDSLFDTGNSQHPATGNSNTGVSFWEYGGTVGKNIPAGTKHVWAHMSEYTETGATYCELTFTVDKKTGVHITGGKLIPVIDGVEQTGIDLAQTVWTVHGLNIEVKSSADSGLLNIWFDDKLMYTYSGAINAGADLGQINLTMGAFVGGRSYASDFIFSDEALEISERIISAPIKDTTMTGADIGSDGICNIYNSGDSIAQTIDTNALTKTIGDTAIVTHIIQGCDPAYKIDAGAITAQATYDGSNVGDAISLGTSTSGKIITSHDGVYYPSELSGKKIGWVVS